MLHIRNAALLVAVAIVTLGCAGQHPLPQKDAAANDASGSKARKYPADATNLPASIFQGYNVTGSRF